MKKIENTQALRTMLLDTIEKVRAGKMTPQDAGAVSRLTGQVLSSARLDFDVAKFTRKHSDAPVPRSHKLIDGK